jgi:hypothetical protein
VGPKVVIGHSGERGDDWQTTLDSLGGTSDFSLAYSAGATVVVQFTPLLGIQADILYSQYSLKYGDDLGWMKYSWNALSFPVYARLSHDFGSVTAYALAGLDMNYIFGDIHAEDSDGQTNSVAADTLFDHTFVLGVGAGAGVTLPIGPGFLDIGLRYRTDFNDKMNSENIFNQSITADVAYRFKVL